jgi:hypothetical protein
MKLFLYSALALVLASSSATAAETVETYFVKNNKVPYGTMTAGPMVGTYAASGFEIGGKFSFEPFPRGFVEPINDSVSFEAGLFRGQSSNWSRMVTTVAMRWDFNLIPLWTVFGAPGISLLNEEHNDYDRNESSSSLALSVGGFLNLAEKQAVRVEFDYGEATMRAGYMFRF